jgi:hypothetical protein
MYHLKMFYKMKKIFAFLLTLITFDIISQTDSKTLFKVINDCQEYPFFCYESQIGKMPEKYSLSKEKYRKLQNGDTCTIDFEFFHPEGFPLTIVKIKGYEDRYHVIAKNALGDLDDIPYPKPVIIWYDLPKETNLLEIELKGKIESHGNVSEFKLDFKIQHLNDKNEFLYVHKMTPGLNRILHKNVFQYINIRRNCN